jgi:hypothetical protein
MKYWETIADNLSKAGWSWGCVSALDCRGRAIWVADAHRGDEKRFIVHTDEELIIQGLLPLSGRLLQERQVEMSFLSARLRLAGGIGSLLLALFLDNAGR